LAAATVRGVTDYENVLTDAESILDDVDAALERLAAGTYGKCAVCGAPIDEARLSATPTVTTCAAHVTAT